MVASIWGSDAKAETADLQSQLSLEVIRAFKFVGELVSTRGLWTVKFVEDVVSELVNVDETTAALSMRPVMIDSGPFSRVERPRLYWFSPPIPDHDAFVW